jgi:hypothetical protein
MSNKLNFNQMTKFISIPAGKLANDDAALKAKREELKKKLLDSKKIQISPTGNVVTGTETGSGFIPPIKLADDEMLKRKRKELKDRLQKSQPVKVSPTGNVITGTEISTKEIPPIKLALNQWYEKDPGLLAAEKAAMVTTFPNRFQLEKLDDGRLAWTGYLNVGVLGDNGWYIMAVYNNNHPEQVMGSSVRVYLVDPDIDDLLDSLGGWVPHHLLLDSKNQKYLCTAEAEGVKTGKEVTSAASVIMLAVKWLACFELVLSGEMTKEEFDRPHGI